MLREICKFTGNIILTLTIILMIADFHPLCAQSLSPDKALAEFNVATYRTRNGLPQNSVTALLQDKRGYLWVGTHSGLARFDGLSFRTFDDKQGILGTSYIHSLIESRDSTIWIGTVNNGLFYLKNGEVKRLTRFKKLMEDDISCMTIDSSGGLWLGTYGDGLMRIHGDTLKRYHSPGGIHTLYFDALKCDHEGNVWIGSRGSGLYKFSHNRFIYYGPKKGIDSDFIRDVEEDSLGRIWVATSGQGLFVLNHGKARCFTTADGLGNNGINCLTIDKAGTVWIGTQGSGLNRYTSAGFDHLTTHQDLTDDVISALLTDTHGDLWIGTLGGGLQEIRKGDFTTYTTDEGLSNNNIWTIYGDQKGRVWIGTNGNGVDVLRNGRVVKRFSTKNGLSNNFVRSIYGDSHGDIWISTYGGLNRIHNGRIVNYTTKNGLASNIALSLYEDSRGRFWIGTSGGGLDRFDHGKFIHFTTKDGLTNNYIRAIQEDDQHRLWLGTGGGGICILKNGRVVRTLTEKDGLPNNIVISFHEDSTHTMWVGTHGGGLARIRGDSIAVIQAKDGLPDNVIFTIFEDHRHRFWMSSNKGIFSIARNSLNRFADGLTHKVHAHLYNTYDGLKSTECNGANQPAGWQFPDGTLWFPTAYGVSTVDPETVNPDTAGPAVYIDRVIANRDELLPQHADTLRAGLHNLGFHYTSPNLAAAGKIHYRFRLTGYDPAWVAAGTQHAAFYTNLPYGSYTFEVMARNPAGVWSSRAARYSLVIPPPFYLTEQAYGIYVMLIFGCLYGFISWQKRQTRKKEQQRFRNEQFRVQAEQEYLRRVASEAKMREKERELELKTKEKEIEIEKRRGELEQAVSRAFAQGIEEERNRIAMDLHDRILGTLSRIMRSTQVGLRHTRQSEFHQNGSFVSEIEGLLPEMDQLGQEIRSIMDDIKPASLDFFSLTEALESVLNKQVGSADYPIRYSVESDVPSTGLNQFARITIYRIMQEAISNAIEHGRPSFVKLHICKNTHSLTFTLEDNGTGFSFEEAIHNIKKRKDKGGHGLMNMIYRANTISASITWQPGPESGTAMTLTLPLRGNT